MIFLKKKANQNDRISDLPSNVIDAILGNLRIRDQVRTSILSKKWRYKWISVPQIYFEEDFFESFIHLDDPVISQIIAEVVMIRNGPIHKFSVCVSGDCEFNISKEKLNMWIPFMSTDLTHLKLLTYCTPPDEHQMPEILFSCKELTYFKFSSFNLSIPPNFCGFKKLLELHLVCVEFETSALESLILGCPFLGKLSIEQCTGCDYLVISSPSLKVLVLTLIYTKSICLEKANNLIDFSLTTYEGRCFIKSLPKIKRFSLTIWEKYEDIIPPMFRTSSFSSLEYLKLDGLNFKESGQLLHIVSILKSAPKLIELDIEEIFDDVNTTQMTDYSKEELECCSSCPKLQTVKINGGSSQHAMSLIKFILANSPSLKSLTFSCIFINLDAPMLLKISQDLLLMERASPRARVSFRY
ncbi:unnamed protein product [Lathyrus sativus]|nr:unnamed protein product [Lathyrus sativus]